MSFGNALLISLLGLGVVFFALVLIMGIILLMTKFSAAAERRTAPAAAAVQAAPTAVQAAADEAPVVQPLTLTLPDTDDLSYRKELRSLLHAYFRPLEKGLSADEVTQFLEQDDLSFEDYLRAHHQIADLADIEALTENYGSLTDQTGAVTVDKADLSAIDAYADGK